MAGLVEPVLVLLSTALLAAVATPAFAWLASRAGLIVQPRKDRWHRRPTPLLGGAAIALAALAALGVVLPQSQPTAVLLVSAVGAFALGLLDDFRHLAPSTKLVGQVLIASVLAAGGIRVEIIEFAPLAYVLTVVWVVAIMNAINLMDNMDGLAAGVTAIAAIVLGLTALPENPLAAAIAACTAGAAIGFLVHNFHPARVFMGDAGSLLLGFLLAATALVHTASSAANLGLAVLGPLAAVALPIFDTTLVTATRRLAGRPISLGGRDHTSHRLAALGLSDRAAVVTLYGVAAALGGMGVAMDLLAGFEFPLAVLAVVGLVVFGAFLLEVEVYPRRGEPEARGPLAQAFMSYGRFSIEIVLDVSLLTAAYYISYAIRFEGLPSDAWLGLFVQSVPFVVGAQLAALVVLGVYRTLWRYLGIAEVVAIFRAITVGTAAAALGILLVARFAGYSRAVFVLDWLLAAVLVVGARAFLLWLRHYFAARPRKAARRVLIVGATDHGLFALRLLMSARETSYHVVGFLDDDPGKRYRRLGGVRIVGTTQDLATRAQRTHADLVVFALDAKSEIREQIRARAEELGLEFRDFLVPV